MRKFRVGDTVQVLHDAVMPDGTPAPQAKGVESAVGAHGEVTHIFEDGVCLVQDLPRSCGWDGCYEPHMLVLVLTYDEAQALLADKSRKTRVALYVNEFSSYSISHVDGNDISAWLHSSESLHEWLSDVTARNSTDELLLYIERETPAQFSAVQVLELLANAHTDSASCGESLTADAQTLGRLQDVLDSISRQNEQYSRVAQVDCLYDLRNLVAAVQARADA